MNRRIDNSAGEMGKRMRRDKRLEFLKSIRLPSEKAEKERSGQETQDNQAHKMTEQEEHDLYELQKELEKRFDELFGSTSED